MSQAIQTVFAPLGRCRTVALTTFGHDGQPVVTRVAFVLDGNRLYVALTRGQKPRSYSASTKTLRLKSRRATAG
ncbi:MAG: hypothetical protein U0703_12880 [Anaerolineae bacterium]